MPTLYDLKPAFQRPLRPIAARLVRSGVTANQVTIATGAAAILLGAVLTVEQRGWVLLPIFLFIRMALNAIDGIMAKEHCQASKLGAILNELLDVISDAALTLPLATLNGWNALAVGCGIFFAALTEMAGLLGTTIGGIRRYDGPFGKGDRAFALGFLGAWLALGWPVNGMVRQTAPAI